MMNCHTRSSLKDLQVVVAKPKHSQSSTTLSQSAISNQPLLHSSELTGSWYSLMCYRTAVFQPTLWGRFMPANRIRRAEIYQDNAK